jgi:hypothetical protein
MTLLRRSPLPTRFPGWRWLFVNIRRPRFHHLSQIDVLSLPLLVAMIGTLPVDLLLW